MVNIAAHEFFCIRIAMIQIFPRLWEAKNVDLKKEFTQNRKKYLLNDKIKRNQFFFDEKSPDGKICRKNIKE